MRSLLAPSIAVCVLAASPSAQAGPTHVFKAQAFTTSAEARTIALEPGQLRAPASIEALTDGLTQAGFQVVPISAHPQLIARVSADLRPICTLGCTLTGHDEAPLDDYYTRRVLVVAHFNGEPSAAVSKPVAWYAALQSDGYSNRERDFLPSMLRAGGKAYGQTIEPPGR